MTAHDDPTGTELLLQRFVDRDLTPDESLALLARIGYDAALRERLVALEELSRDARRLPAPAVPSAFVAGVLARMTDADDELQTAAVPADRDRPAPMPHWRRALASLVAPRTLRWNLASAVGGLALIAAAGLAASIARDPASTEDRIAASDTTPPVLVRLVVLQPAARTVHVAGDFNGWAPSATPLEPLANGAWTVTLPLDPGRYEYMFVVDGDEWVADPYALEHRDDGFGAENAVLDVRRPREGSS